ncbi:MAG TPA: hypothetical protein VFY06_06100 [Verrucomicrobiae bacterium]|nr:hypothetical protein [Verrucomicrobiae bacterium]
MSAIATKNDEIFSAAAFKAVIFYDDPGCAARAATSLERALHASDETSWDVKSWRLDALRQPPLSVVTIAIAADANLIVFALNDAHPPLDELFNWLEDWSARRHVEDAAVTLLDAFAEPAVPLQNELERFARQHGLAFLGAGQAWTDRALTSGYPWQPHLHPLGALKSPPLVEPEPAPDPWGIND